MEDQGDRHQETIGVDPVTNEAEPDSAAEKAGGEPESDLPGEGGGSDEALSLVEGVTTKVLLEGDRFKRTLTRMAHEIIEQVPSGEELALVGIQRRGVELGARLVDLIEEFTGRRPLTGSIDITFYRDDVDTRVPSPAYDQPMVHSTSLPFDVGGKIIVIVDDVLYTGRTIRAAIDALFDYGRPSAVRLAVLIDRGHRELPIRPDFVGKNVPTSRSERVTVLLQEVDGKDEVILEKG